MEQEKILSLILDKLENIDIEQRGIKNDIHEMKSDMQEMKNELQEIKTEQQTMNTELQTMNTELQTIKARQDEMYMIQRGIKENIKITRAEQEKMQYTLADIQGKVTTLANEVKDHDDVINQIRAIK